MIWCQIMSDYIGGWISLTAPPCSGAEWFWYIVHRLSSIPYITSNCCRTWRGWGHYWMSISNEALHLLSAYVWSNPCQARLLLILGSSVILTWIVVIGWDIVSRSVTCILFLRREQGQYSSNSGWVHNPTFFFPMHGLDSSRAWVVIGPRPIGYQLDNKKGFVLGCNSKDLGWSSGHDLREWKEFRKVPQLMAMGTPDGTLSNSITMIKSWPQSTLWCRKVQSLRTIIIEYACKNGLDWLYIAKCSTFVVGFISQIHLMLCPVDSNSLCHLNDCLIYFIFPCQRFL